MDTPGCSLLVYTTGCHINNHSKLKENCLLQNSRHLLLLLPPTPYYTEHNCTPIFGSFQTINLLFFMVFANFDFDIYSYIAPCTPKLFVTKYYPGTYVYRLLNFLMQKHCFLYKTRLNTLFIPKYNVGFLSH